VAGPGETLADAACALGASALADSHGKEGVPSP
jgi:hypothetical protein